MAHLCRYYVELAMCRENMTTMYITIYENSLRKRHYNKKVKENVLVCYCTLIGILS